MHLLKFLKYFSTFRRANLRRAHSFILWGFFTLGYASKITGSKRTQLKQLRISADNFVAGLEILAIFGAIPVFNLTL